MSEPILARIDHARRLLAEANTLQAALNVATVCRAALVFARQMKSSAEAKNLCIEMELRAERAIGEMLKKTPRNKGGSPKLTGSSQEPVAPPLSAVGITKKQSMRAQQLATVPEAKFDAVIAEQKAAERPISKSSVLRVLAAPEKPRPTFNEVPYRPANGLEYAQKAILNLEQIRHDDLEREAAFAEVERYIAKQRRKELKHAS